MGCKHSYKMLDEAEKLTCDKCLEKIIKKTQQDTIDQIVALIKAQGWLITEKEKPLKKKIEYQKVDMDLTECLINRMFINNPNSSTIKGLTPTRRKDWYNSCRLMREKDGRTPDQILAMIDFSQKDSFWKSNILSMPKLREKFDQLWLRAQKENYEGIKKWIDEKRKEETSDPF